MSKQRENCKKGERIWRKLKVLQLYTHTHTIHLPKQYAKNARANLDEINKRGGSYIINKDNRHYY